MDNLQKYTNKQSNFDNLGYYICPMYIDFKALLSHLKPLPHSISNSFNPHVHLKRHIQV